MAKRTIALLALYLILVAGTTPALPEAACPAPEPVCAQRRAVFAVSSWDPSASAVLVAPDLLVTNRHVVADESRAIVYLPGGETRQAEVIPTAYARDLILLRVRGLPAGTPPEIVRASADAVLYTVAADPDDRRIRTYAPGRILLLPPPDKPLARIHHTAESGPGNSGGALLDGQGRLVAIVTAGGDGRNEAIPATEISSLRNASGPRFRDTSLRRGRAYRDCLETLERIPRRVFGLARAAVTRIVNRCTASGNRQLMDLAGQALGRAGQTAEAIKMFARSLDQDPNALNARIGLVVTLLLERRYADAVPHLKWLIGILPQDAQVLRLALQAGRFGEDEPLVRDSLALIERYHPRMAEAARRFLQAPLPAPSDR